MRAPTRVYTRCAPPDSADLAERRNGKAGSKVLAAAGAIGAPLLAERANPRAIGSPVLLDEVVVRTRLSIAVRLARGLGDQPLARLPYASLVEARKQKNAA